jgi:hypothetical protein
MKVRYLVERLEESSKEKRKSKKQLLSMWSNYLKKYGYKVELDRHESFPGEITLNVFGDFHDSYDHVDSLMGDRSAYIMYDDEDSSDFVVGWSDHGATFSSGYFGKEWKDKGRGSPLYYLKKRLGLKEKGEWRRM